MNLKVRQLKVITSKILLISYIGCAILGFFHVMQMAMMAMPLDDCPFSQMLLQTVGGNTVSNHLQILNLPIITVLSFLEIGLFFVILFRITETTNESLRFSTISHNIYKKRNRLRYSLFTSLFSNGILNPKTF